MQIHIVRLNGLRLEAAKERRTVAAQLDMILEKAGVVRLTDKEYEQKVKEAGLGFLEMKART